jgi:hypothetical protein
MDAVSKLAVLRALGPLGKVEREAYNKVITLLALNSSEPLDPEQKKLGAVPGMFVFRGTAQVYRPSFIALPLYEHIQFVEWPPERDKVAPLNRYAVRPPEAVPGDRGEWRMPETDTRIVRTRYLYLALANTKGEIDFSDIWALAIYSTGLGFFDREFASQYPMSINIDGYVKDEAPIGCCKWKFVSELHSDGRNQWMRVKYIKGSKYGEKHRPTWDELVRAAEIEAEMMAADALAHGQAAPQIEAKAAPTISVDARERGQATITSGRAAYNPGPPKPPPVDENGGDGPGDPASAEYEDVGF